MSSQRTLSAWAVIGLILAFGLECEAQARQGRRPSRPAVGDIDTASAVFLDRLSVKMLGIDRPWDPRICIGCEPRGRASPRSGLTHSR